MALVFVALGSQGGKCVEGDYDCYAIGAMIGAFLVLAWLLGAAVLGVIRLAMFIRVRRGVHPTP